MPLRILIVSDVYAPLIGGVERQMHLLGKKLVERGHRVAVATPWQVGLSQQENDGDVAVYRIKGLASRVPWFSKNPMRRHHPPIPDPATVWKLRQVINRFQPDVIHAYGWITYSCVVALVGKQIPLLLSVREYAYTCALRTMLRYGTEPCDGPALIKCMVCANSYFGQPKGLAATLGVYIGRLLLRWKTRGIHSVSTYMQHNIERDLFPQPAEGEPSPLPHVVIPSFRDNVAVQKTERLKHYMDQLPDTPFILFVGALRRVKGIEPLIKAYQSLESPPQLVLIGPRASDTPKQIPPTIQVLYDFPHDAVMAAWNRALFGVAPSIWPEPFGSVIHEGMSKGKPFIGTTPGGQTDMIVAGETGLLVPPNDVAALAEAMQLLIDDSELRERLGRASREQAKLFTADTVVPRFEQLYQSLVDTTHQTTSNKKATTLQ